jgi:hypothetical protein
VSGSLDRDQRVEHRHVVSANGTDVGDVSLPRHPKEQRVVIVRAFIKKTEKTPTGEIDLALQRAKELKP